MSERRSNQPHSKSLSIRDGDGNELLGSQIERQETVVIATDASGNSLTLLEELAARKKSRVSPAEFLVSFVCATASLAFAALIYFNDH
ncbi:hypothetical protein [Pelagicoccus albus]|uniref:Uncharacterized protein n=1 Tax=Pelagicoccus albus TaxID=415222 RepID=A0A7X1B5F3_9BACT|nr:hypothetical protein [Pelagicoccus albus]MBC2604888.1 hypothetical protein [Pelagicoccus albus]